MGRISYRDDGPGDASTNVSMQVMDQVRRDRQVMMFASISSK
jgi:hypothetical protein